MDFPALKAHLSAIQTEAETKLQDIADTKALNEWRVLYLGKKSEMTGLSKQMGQLEASEKPQFGQSLNQVRQALEAKWNDKREALAAAEQSARLMAETIDVTLPGRRANFGAMHPISKVIREIEDVFLGMGFLIADGPEVETDKYNFEMLNLPKDHPARDMQDTFYITEELLMRTHTSPMQVRTMERLAPQVPVKVLVPGRVYRRDEDDATHSHAFTQIEGLVVGEGIRMSDLKGTLEQFARALFGEHQQVRLRPSFFPFTEPSAEVDLICVQCQGEGCRVCKQTGWIEILGSGMVHPRVLDMAGYDSSRYTGFAFGMGAERVAMLKYGIPDIRQFYQNDLRLLSQFATI
ncbi:phenylalanine--tRNA ligase subunit alpha [Alicyclobacillus fodiniaquatilis]|uniref:Phenylalanine--tRNA ligase alpha subunit n=1 Tax=Alicyclobacillus fodiniaquatilis TaxID=1661150 RepID=A0ABW4JMV2_9BACL